MVTAKRVGHLQYAVTSESGDECYSVNMEFKSCSCPHHRFRGAFCKHLTACHWAETARDIKEDDLAPLYFKYEEKDPAIAAAILAEIERRQWILEAQTELRALFA